MKFSLTKKQEKMVAKWVKKQDKAYAKKNNSELGYYGAIGGGITYQITYTSIGTIIKVLHPTGKILDITDYDSW